MSLHNIKVKYMLFLALKIISMLRKIVQIMLQIQGINLRMWQKQAEKITTSKFEKIPNVLFIRDKTIHWKSLP